MRYIKVQDCGSCDNSREDLRDHYYCIHTEKRIFDLNKIDKDCPLPHIHKGLIIGTEEVHFIRPPKTIIIESGEKTLIDMDFVGQICIISVKGINRIEDTLFIEV